DHRGRGVGGRAHRQHRGLERRRVELRRAAPAAMEGILTMEISLRHTPSFGVARLMLTPNETAKVESGAMYAMSAGVSLESKMDGGFLRAAKRAMLGGESFFISTYTAPAQGGFVDVAARLPGDL